MSPQKERPLGGSCQTFYFFLLHLIKRLGEDQPRQIKNVSVGLARTGHGCPNQGLLGLLGNCRFIEISLEWVQMQVRPSCWQTIAKVMQMSPANRQFSGPGSSIWGLQASFCRGAVEIVLFLGSGPKCILHFCYVWLLHWYVLYGQIEDHRTAKAFLSSPLLKAYLSFWPRLKLYSQDKHHIMYFHSFDRNVVVMVCLVCICTAPRWAGDAAGLVFAVKRSELQLDSVSSVQVHSICQISDWEWSCRADLRP